MSRRTVIVLACTVALAVVAPAAAADAADVKPLPKLLTTAAEWDDRTRDDLDAATRRRFAELAAAVPDAALRERATKLLPDLERAAVQHARARRVQADVAA